MRRIAKAVAPGWRLLATDQIEPDTVVIDSAGQYIAVGEGSATMNVVVSILLHLGFVRVSHRYDLLFGKNIRSWEKTEDSLVHSLTSQGVSAEKKAKEWAMETALSMFPFLNPYSVMEAMSWYSWDNEAWTKYFSDGPLTDSAK